VDVEQQTVVRAALMLGRIMCAFEISSALRRSIT